MEELEAVARERYPAAAELLVANVVDLHKIPFLLRKVAEGVLNSEHRKALEGLGPGQAAEDYVVILPDWDGSAVRGFGLEDATRTLGLASVGAQGEVLWRYQGENPGEELRKFLEGASQR